MKTTLHNVQMLRFLAAAMVLISHLQHEVPSVRGLDVHDYTPWTPIWFAGGVDIFFVISGFIMYIIAADTFGKPNASQEFFIRRLLRVVPPYWLFTTAMLVAAIVFKEHVAHAAISIPHIVASYLFVPWQNPYGKFYPILMLGWTLNFEMLFYVIFALALRFSPRVGLIFIAATITSIALCGVVLELHTTPFAFWLNPIVMEFLFGIALAYVFRQGVRWRLVTGLPVIAAGVGVMIWMQYSGIAGNYWSARFLWMGLPALAVCTGAILIEKQAATNRLQRAVVLGGDASFVLYLSHPFSLAVVAALWPRVGISSPTVYVVCAGIAAFASAVILHVWLEKPCMAYLNAHIRSKRPASENLTIEHVPLGLPHAVKS